MVDIQQSLIKRFWPLFCQTPKIFKTSDGERIELFDVASQIFVFAERNTAIYSVISEELKQVINKIIKDNNFSKLTYETITIEHITEFRRLFWKHPEIVDTITLLLKENSITSEIEALNMFYNEMARLKIYDDETLVKLREFRIFIAQKSIAFSSDELTDENLKNDLYYFLNFDRFNIDEEIIKDADETLNEICRMIQSGECPDMRTFKTFKDRDLVPMVIVDKIERLVLMNYCDKPDKKVVKEIRDAVNKMDLGILKKYLNFNPVERQKYALIFEARENLAANCRRSGKSWLMVYIAIRQIFLPGQMILYMLPVKEDYSEQPFFYIEQMVENIKKSGAELEWFQFNSKLFKCTNKLFKSKIIFLSAQGSSKGKSFSANLAIMDEAAYIENGNIYDQLSNSTSDTKGRMWAVSTINIDTPINWFFYKKISLDGMEDCKVHSIDIYNNPFMSELEKKRKENQFKDKNQKVWLADWMAIFVWGADGFDISTFFQISFNYDVVTFKWCRFNLARNLDKYSRFLLSYDPAKNMDRAWLIILWQIWNRCEVVLTWYIDIKNYFLQWEVIIEILEYIKKIKTIEYAIDLGKAWEAAFDYFESRKYSPYGILSTWWATVKKETFRRWNVPALQQEQTLHTMLAAGVVKWFSWLDFIRNEFETYNLAKERQWNLWHHHDVISALMMAVFIWYERWLIGFDKRIIQKANDEVLLDSNWLPYKNKKPWIFDGGFLWRFMH